MDVDINTIRYKGTDTAVTVEGWWNRVRIGRIYSDGIGLTIQSANDSTVYNQITLNDVISKEAHGIVVANGGNPIFQTKFSLPGFLERERREPTALPMPGMAAPARNAPLPAGRFPAMTTP